jgi:TP901 family phage tail tape measure protein
VGNAASLGINVFPTTKDFAASLQAQVMPSATEVGAKTGRSFSAAFSAEAVKGGDGADLAIANMARTSQLAIESAAAKVVAARARESDAAGRVRIAEQQLAEARAKYAADSSQVVAAEERLATAQRNVEVRADASGVAEGKLSAVRQESRTAALSSAAATDTESASLGKFKTLAADTSTTAGGLMSQYGKLGALIGVAIGVDMGIKGVQAASAFQQSQERLVTTAGELQTNLTGVSNGILAMAGQVGYSAQDLSTGMYTVESAGYHASDALTVLKASAQGAKEENADLSNVTDAVTSAMRDYHLPVDQAATVTSKLITAVSDGKTNFQDLTGAMSAVLPKASAVGISLNDVLGDLAGMTLHGVSAEQASQNLADAISHLSNPTVAMTKEMASLGLSSADLSKNLGKTGVQGTMEEVSQAILQHMGPAGTTLLNAFNQSKVAAADAKAEFNAMPASLQKVAQAYSNGQLTLAQWRTQLKGIPADQQALLTSYKSATDSANGFNAALKSGGNASQTYSQALAKATGDSSSMNVALMLTGENAAKVQQNISDVARASTEAGGNVKGWSDIQQTFNQRVAEVKASLGAFAIEIGQKLLPVLTGMIGGLQNAVGWLIQNRVWIGLVAAVVGGLVGPIVAVRLAVMAWEAVRIVVLNLRVAMWLLNSAILANPVVALSLAIAALVAGIVYAYFHFQTFRNIINDIGNFFKVVFLAVIHAVGDAIGWLVDHWKIFAGILAVIFAPISIAIGLFVLIVTHLHQIGDAFVWLWQNIIQPTLNVIGVAIRIVAAILYIVLVLPWVELFQHVLAPLFTWLYNTVIKPAFEGIAVIAKWLYDNGIKPVFDAIGAVFAWINNNVIQPWVVVAKIAFQLFMDAVHAVYDNAIKPVFDLINNIFTWVHDHVIQPFVTGCKIEFELFKEAFKAVYDNVIKPVGDAIGSAVSGIKNAFTDAVNAIKTAWGTIENIVKVPAKFVVDLVYNKGIVPLWNSVAGIFGLGKLGAVDVSSWAGGGILPGYAPGQDSIPAMLSPGESVLTPEATRFLGAQTILALNAMSGRPSGNDTNGMPIHAAGGFFGDVWGALSSGAKAVWGGITDAAHWAASIAGDVAGGITKLFQSAIDQNKSTPGGADSWKTMITDIPGDVIQGAINTVKSWFSSSAGQKVVASAQGGGAIGGTIPTGQRLAILTQALQADNVPQTSWGVWEAGLNTLITRESGWNPNAVNNTDSNAKAGHPSTGLMQTIIGTFEAYRNPAFPDSMVNPVANVAAGIKYIISRYGDITRVQQANANLPPKGYDNGGMLPIGMSLAYNGTTRPEPVLTGDQWDTLRSRAAPEQAGSTHHYHITSHDPASVAHEIERRETANMRARL